MGGAPAGPLLAAARGASARSAGPRNRAARCRRARPAPRPRRSGGQRLLGRLSAAARPQAEDHPSRAALWSLVLAAVADRRRVRCSRAISRGRCATRASPSSASAAARRRRRCPSTARRRSSTLNRGVNRMIANLRQLEHDRAVLLAGVSHDLRTPLARLRLGIEMEARDEATRAGMVDDIEEMDRIIGQFLEFARTNEDAASEPRDANEIVRTCVDRYARAGNDVRFDAAAPLPAVPLRPTAFSRLVANLIDNAIAYGAPPVEVTTRVARRTRRARRRRPRTGHRAGAGRAAEAAVHARLGSAGGRRRHRRRGTRPRDRRPDRAAARRDLRSLAARRRRDRRPRHAAASRPDRARNR